MRNLDQKIYQRQNTVCLEQQIYTSPENFTPTLLVMLETFRRSAPELTSTDPCLPGIAVHQSTQTQQSDQTISAPFLPTPYNVLLSQTGLCQIGAAAADRNQGYYSNLSTPPPLACSGLFKRLPILVIF